MRKIIVTLCFLVGLLASAANAAVQITVTGIITYAGGTAYAEDDTYTITLLTNDALGSPNSYNTTSHVEWMYDYTYETYVWESVTIDKATGTWTNTFSSEDDPYSYIEAYNDGELRLEASTYDRSVDSGLYLAGKNVYGITIPLSDVASMLGTFAGDSSVTVDNFLIAGTYTTDPEAEVTIETYGGGYSTYYGNVTSIVVTNVPEPRATVAALALGALLVTLWRRRR